MSRVLTQCSIVELKLFSAQLTTESGFLRPQGLLSDALLKTGKREFWPKFRGIGVLKKPNKMPKQPKSLGAKICRGSEKHMLKIHQIESEESKLQLRPFKKKSHSFREIIIDFNSFK